MYKGVYEYVNPITKDRYMIFNYITQKYEGDLLENCPEGKAEWIHINEAYHLPMQPSIKRRFPLFFEEGTFEIHVEWNHEDNKEGKVTIRRT